MDAITMLRNDHRTVEKLFKRFEAAGERAFATKRTLADRIIEELSQHASIEEQVFYPVARATVPSTEDVVLESLEEHHIVKWVLSELDGMDADAERFEAKMTVLIENVRHHVHEEEQEFFPKVRASLDRKALVELGEAMQKAKESAPTHPHPRAADTPPANAAGGLTVGVVDRIGDTVSGVAQGSVTAVQDLIARILGRPKRAAAPTGSTVTRGAAGNVRAGASSLTDDAVAAAVRAKDTAAAAKSEATRTAKTALDGTKRTARVAGGERNGAATKAPARATATKPTAKKTTPRKTTARKSASKPSSAKPKATRSTGTRKAVAASPVG